jgi:hypothetical protein
MNKGRSVLDLIFFLKITQILTRSSLKEEFGNIINIDNIFAMFGGRVLQQTLGIPTGTNCAPLLADFFLYNCKVHNGKIEIISFVVKFHSQPPLTVNFEV